MSHLAHGTHGSHGEGDVKTVRLFAAVIAASLLCSHMPVRAQPASEPVPAGDAPVQPDRDPARIDDDPMVIDESDKPWSEGVPVESRTAAREVFREGYRLAVLSAYRIAEEKFTAALATWKHPAFYYNLALSQLYLGQEVEARENLERALEYGEDPLGAEYFQEAQMRLHELKRRLGRIRVTCRTPGAVVTLDGVTLFTGPGSHEGWIKAKAYELSAKKAGYQSEARRVTVPAGDLLNVDLSLITLTQAADISRRWPSWTPWAAVTTGVAVASAGGVLHGFASRNLTKYDEDFSKLSCALNKGCKYGEIPDGYSERLTRARRQQVAAVTSYVAGGSLIAAGFALLYLNQPRLVEQRGESSRTRDIAVTPAMSGDVFTVMVSVRR